MSTPSSSVGVQTNVLICSPSPLNWFSIRSRTAVGTWAECSATRSIAVVAVEDVQVEVVGIRHLPAHLAAAAPRHAQARGTAAHGRPAALLAAPPALVLEEAKLSGVELTGSRAAGQRPAPPLEHRRHQDPELAQRLPEVFEEGLDVVAGDAPRRHRARHLRRALPDPLQHARAVVGALRLSFRPFGPPENFGK